MPDITTGQFWYMRDKSHDTAEVFYGEITKVCGDAVIVYIIPDSGWNEGQVSYDARLLDFVGRDYEREEQKAQAVFLEQLAVHDKQAFDEPTYTHDDMEDCLYRSMQPVPEVARNPPKLSWWTRLKMWWISHDYHY